MVEARLRDLMSLSTRKLESMEEFGYDWKPSSRMPSATTNIFSGTATGCKQTPIALSSGSDSEDDVPLALRIKKPASVTPVSDEDLPLSSRMQAHDRAAQGSQPQRAHGKQNGSSGLERQKSQSQASVQPKREPELGTQASMPGQKVQGDAGSRPGVWEHISSRQAPPPVPARKPPLKKAAQAGSAAAVIDLESDVEMDPLSPPPRTGFRHTSLKSVQRTNPQLGKAVKKLVEAQKQRDSKASGPAAQLPNLFPSITKDGAGRKASQKVASSRQGKTAAGEGTQKSKPNWTAAGNAFWEAMGVIKTTKPVTKASSKGPAKKKAPAAANASPSKSRSKAVPEKAPSMRQATPPEPPVKSKPAVPPPAAASAAVAAKRAREEASGDGDAGFSAQGPEPLVKRRPTVPPPAAARAAVAAKRARVESHGEGDAGLSNQPSMERAGTNASEAEASRREPGTAAVQDAFREAPAVPGREGLPAAAEATQATGSGLGNASRGPEDGESCRAASLGGDAVQSGGAAGEAVAEGDPREDLAVPAIPREEGVEDEEWKARRIEIEKQAAEARALKKRKRAENEAKNRAETRLAEHRQELVDRENALIQKEQMRRKAREALQLKLRGKKGLREILMGLGITVEGVGAAPVTKAYRKALLLYHPDRHVGESIQQQIHSEEVFKVISEAANS